MLALGGMRKAHYQSFFTPTVHSLHTAFLSWQVNTSTSVPWPWLGRTGLARLNLDTAFSPRALLLYFCLPTVAIPIWKTDNVRILHQLQCQAWLKLPQRAMFSHIKEHRLLNQNKPRKKQRSPKKTMTLDHPIHIYCVFVLKIFQKGHGYLYQHCQMLNYTNASIWRKKRFRCCLAQTNYILILTCECVCLGGLSWRVQWAFQMWEFPQLLKLTDGLTAGAIIRNSGPNLPQFISSEMCLDSWHKSFHPLEWGCDNLQGVHGLQM